MQCACPNCGLLMSWHIKGLESECCCPECGYFCAACLGTKSVMSAEDIRRLGEGYWQRRDDDVE